MFPGRAASAAIGLVVVLTACSASQNPEVQRADGFVAMIATTSDEAMEAEVGGEFATNDAGCAGVSMDDIFYPVLWPEGTSVSEDGLTFADGTTVGPGGTWSGGGGETLLPSDVYPDLPNECAVEAETTVVVANSASGS